MAVVAALLVGPSAWGAAAPSTAAAPVVSAAPGGASGALGLGGGLSGAIDERTGLLGIQVPVVAVTGVGSAGVSWSLSWDQGRATQGIDRSDFGAGWSLDTSFVDARTPVTVYPAAGGVYRMGGTYPPGWSTTR